MSLIPLFMFMYLYHMRDKNKTYAAINEQYYGVSRDEIYTTINSMARYLLIYLDIESTIRVRLQFVGRFKSCMCTMYNCA